MLLTWPSCGELIIKCSLASMHAGLASCENYPSDKSTPELKIGTTASTKSLNRILKELDQNNYNRPIISQLRIKSIRNKFIFFALHIKDSLDNLYHLRQKLKIYFPQHSFYWIAFQDLRYSYWNHGTVPRTGITSKKISCNMRGSIRRWLIIENAKIFGSYVKHFWISLRERNCRILIGLCQ